MTRYVTETLAPYILAVLIILSACAILISPAPTATNAAAASTATPAPMVTPTPGNTGQASIFWGDTLNLLCYESTQAKEQHEPSGILNFDVTDSGVVAINCREPGTEANDYQN